MMNKLRDDRKVMTQFPFCSEYAHKNCVMRHLTSFRHNRERLVVGRRCCWQLSIAFVLSELPATKG